MHVVRDDLQQGVGVMSRDRPPKVAPELNERRVSDALVDRRDLRGKNGCGESKQQHLVQRDDHLVGADQPEVLAHELIGHVRVGLVRVEQPRMVAQLRFLLLELR